MKLLDLLEVTGTWLYFNPTQIVAITSSKNGETIIYANGSQFEVKEHIDTVKKRIAEIQ